jgi:hypothetical protein
MQGSNDPEDGINDRIENTLRERKCDVKVSTWDELWLCLFPNDDKRSIPAPGKTFPNHRDCNMDINTVGRVSPPHRNGTRRARTSRGIGISSRSG